MAEQQTPGRPEEQSEDWQKDLNPHPMAGRNVGLEGEHPEKDAPNASEIKEIQRQLPELTNDELKQIPVLPAGSRLEQGAKYINLKDAKPKEFVAMGVMEAGPDNWYVPKTEVGYQLWNRLTGVQNPERTGEGNQT